MAETCSQKDGRHIGDGDDDDEQDQDAGGAAFFQNDRGEEYEAEGDVADAGQADPWERVAGGCRHAEHDGTRCGREHGEHAHEEDAQREDSGEPVERRFWSKPCGS